MRGVLVSIVLAAAAAPAGLRLFEKGQPQVAEGLRAYERNDFEGALKAFDEARRAMPNHPVVELDRGAALYRLGRLEEAKEAFKRASELDDGQLESRDEYDLGTTLAKLGQRDEAIKALRRALVKDPGNDSARHNLEVLLRQLPPGPPTPGDAGVDGGQDSGTSPDGGQPDAGKPDSGADGGQDAGPQDGGQDGGASDGGSDAGQDGGSGGQDGGRDGGQSGEAKGDGGRDGGSDAGQQGSDGGAQSPEPASGVDGGTPRPDVADIDAGAGEVPSLPQMERDDAERTLDAVRQNERNLQLWRFQQKKRPRKPNEKDW